VGLIEHSSVPGRVTLALPRGWPAGNPGLTMTNASTAGHWVHVRLDARCLCATGIAPEYRWGAGTVCRLVTVAVTRPAGGFRLWRTPPGVGNAEAWVCVVLSCKGRKPKPEGFQSRRHDAKGRRR
jgi:hypothetical protein